MGTILTIFFFDGAITAGVNTTIQANPKLRSIPYTTPAIISKCASIAIKTIYKYTAATVAGTNSNQRTHGVERIFFNIRTTMPPLSNLPLDLRHIKHSGNFLMKLWWCFSISAPGNTLLYCEVLAGFVVDLDKTIKEIPIASASMHTN